jgi:fumarate hydratase subunit alpha
MFPKFSVYREDTEMVSGDVVEKVAYKLLQLAVTQLPTDIKDALRQAYDNEDAAVAKGQLKAILDNIELAQKTGSPMCQDTGTITYYVKAGTNVYGLDQIKSALETATARATKDIPLRPNAVDPFTEKNSGNNLGRNTPYIQWEIVPGNSIEITVDPKGGGSENVSALAMLNPSQGVTGLKKFVIDTIIAAGAKPCPPTVVGVAVGGGADTAIKLAKMALLKPVGQRNREPELAKLEQELLEAANQTGIGPMGLGGKTTVLDVKVDYAYRHPASYPVAVVFQCWAARRPTAKNG